MNKKIVLLAATLLILILAIVVLLTYRNKSQPTSPQPQQKTEVKNQAENIEVDKSKNFSVVLDSNPTTGYQWDAKFDESFIKLVSSNYMPNPQTRNNVGAGGTQNFEFSALKSGETEMTFYYARSWEKDNPAETKIFKVIIK
jgi:inhibitor of cysteine peptidase